MALFWCLKSCSREHGEMLVCNRGKLLIEKGSNGVIVAHGTGG